MEPLWLGGGGSGDVCYGSVTWHTLTDAGLCVLQSKETQENPGVSKSVSGAG